MSSMDFWGDLATGPEEATVLVDPAGGPTTAGDIRRQAHAISQKLGAGSEPIYLYCEGAGYFLAGLLGALATGRDVMLPGHTTPAYLAEIGATTSPFVTDRPELAEAVLRLPIEASGKPPPNFAERPHQGKVSFFTSGSAGEPKRCEKVLSQLTAEVEVLQSLWPMSSGSVLGTVSHQHIYGLLFRILWPLTTGRRIFAQQLSTWEAVAVHLEADSVLISSPTHLSRIPNNLSLPQRPVIVFSSGGALSAEAAISASEAIGTVPVEVLGSTETGGVAWRRQETPGVPWTPLPSVEIAAGQSGVLQVRSAFAGGNAAVEMGDRVTILPDNQFILLGRVDRIVKIEGKRVALPRVEENLLAMPGIGDAAAVDLPDRNGALGAVVVLDEIGQAALGEVGQFRYTRALRADLASRLEPMERPRFWRFVDRIPTNPQGKRITADLRTLFAPSDRNMPPIKDRQVGPDRASFELDLVPDLTWFDGHFPNQPILPGVAQLHIAACLAEDVWQARPTGRKMSRIKFRRVLRPGECVTLTLARSGEDRIDFQYLSDGETVASGSFRGGHE